MKITVKSVTDDSFKGKDGPVQAAKLRYATESGVESELPGYGPSMSTVLAWKAGEEQEIEPYTTKSGKQAFRLPNSGGGRGGGGGGFAAAWRNTEAGQKYEQDNMTVRTAVMQAIAAKPGDFDEALAGRILAWMRKNAASA